MARACALARRDRRERAAVRAPGRSAGVRGVAGVAPRAAVDRAGRGGPAPRPRAPPDGSWPASSARPTSSAERIGAANRRRIAGPCGSRAWRSGRLGWRRSSAPVRDRRAGRRRRQRLGAARTSQPVAGPALRRPGRRGRPRHRGGCRPPLTATAEPRAAEPHGPPRRVAWPHGRLASQSRSLTAARLDIAPLRSEFQVARLRVLTAERARVPRAFRSAPGCAHIPV